MENKKNTHAKYRFIGYLQNRTRFYNQGSKAVKINQVSPRDTVEVTEVSWGVGIKKEPTS